MVISDVFVFTDLRSWFLPGRFDLFACAKKMLVEGIMFWVWRDDKLRFDYENAFLLAGLVWNRGHVYYDLKLKSLTLLNEKKCNNCFNLTIPVVMKIAVATLGNFHAKPFGPELQVKQMLHRRFAREDWERNKFEGTWFEKKNMSVIGSCSCLKWPFLMYLCLHLWDRDFAPRV